MAVTRPTDRVVLREFAREALDTASPYPRAGSVPCEVLAEWEDPQGGHLARVSTARPADIESVDGTAEFVVRSAQLLT